MSLINDALKRAEAAQEKTERNSGPNLNFRPVDAKEPAQSGFGWVWPWIVTVGAVAAVFVIWQLNHRGKEQEPAEKKTPATAKAGDQSQASENGSKFLPTSTLKVHAREPEPGGAPAVAVTSDKAPSEIATEKVAVVALSGITVVETTPPNKTEETNAAAATENGPVRPTGPKLQAIVFNPANPSAIINGKTVFIGEKVGELRVLGIEKDSATVASGGETNVLRLDQ